MMMCSLWFISCMPFTINCRWAIMGQKCALSPACAFPRVFLTFWTQKICEIMETQGTWTGDLHIFKCISLIQKAGNLRFEPTKSKHLHVQLILMGAFMLNLHVLQSKGIKWGLQRLNYTPSFSSEMKGEFLWFYILVSMCMLRIAKRLVPLAM